MLLAGFVLHVNKSYELLCAPHSRNSNLHSHFAQSAACSLGFVSLKKKSHFPRAEWDFFSETDLKHRVRWCSLDTAHRTFALTCSCSYTRQIAFRASPMLLAGFVLHVNKSYELLCAPHSRNSNPHSHFAQSAACSLGFVSLKKKSHFPRAEWDFFSETDLKHRVRWCSLDTAHRTFALTCSCSYTRQIAFRASPMLLAGFVLQKKEIIR